LKNTYNKTIAGIIVLLWFAFGTICAQEHNLKRELLVYIIPDSLELPEHEKGKLSIDRADIKSVVLATTLSKIKAISIERAFPVWSNRDSVITHTDGERVLAPPFHRIFKLFFNSEEEADSAIAMLKQVNAVVFAEKILNLHLITINTI
jgi:hypothetical protein